LKSVILIGLTILIIGATQFIDFSKEKIDKNSGIYSIAIHGGAGTISKDLPDSVIKEYIQSLTDALKIGQNILESGGSSLDAVEQVVKFLEDDPKFNAGRGAVFTSEGLHELDASIMSGKDLSSGAVASVKGVKKSHFTCKISYGKNPSRFINGERGRRVR
jgi:L-asparaginase / beta-aspartyl-peptidase